MLGEVAAAAAAPAAPAAAEDAVAQHVLRAVVAQSCIVAARCARVSRLWRRTIDAVMGPDGTLQNLYNVSAWAFVATLPAMRLSFADVTAPDPVEFITDNVGNDGPANFDVSAIRAAVRHLVRGLQALLHCSPAVCVCVQEAFTILHKLRQLRSHPGILAGPITWTLMRVLCAHPGHHTLGLETTQLISAFMTTMSEGGDMVVLSAAKRVRAIAVLEAFLLTIGGDSTSAQNVRGSCHDVLEWIEAGARLSVDADSDADANADADSDADADADADAM